jgi:hypothetical protein
MNINHQNNISYLMKLSFFCFIGLFSCFVTHSGEQSVSYIDKATLKPKIIFLNYSINLNSTTREVDIQLINKIITEGKLKTNSQEPPVIKPGDLKCVTLNNRFEPLDSIIIADPLNITIESVDEKNSLFKREINRDSSHFSIRLQLNEKIHYVAIKKNINSDDQNSYLLITEIL